MAHHRSPSERLPTRGASPVSGPSAAEGTVNPQTEVREVTSPERAVSVVVPSTAAAAGASDAPALPRGPGDRGALRGRRRHRRRRRRSAPALLREPPRDRSRCRSSPSPRTAAGPPALNAGMAAARGPRPRPLRRRPRPGARLRGRPPRGPPGAADRRPSGAWGLYRNVFPDTPYARAYGRPATARSLERRPRGRPSSAWRGWAANNSVTRPCGTGRAVSTRGSSTGRTPSSGSGWRRPASASSWTRPSSSSTGAPPSTRRPEPRVPS